MTKRQISDNKKESKQKLQGIGWGGGFNEIDFPPMSYCIPAPPKKQTCDEY